MPSQRPHPDMTLVMRNDRSLVNRQNEHKCGPSGNSQLPPGMRRISILAGERDSSQRGSSVASTIRGLNSTHSSSLNNAHVADTTQCMTSTPVATQRWSIIPPTAMLGTCSRSRPAHEGTAQRDSTRHVVSNPASGIAHTCTYLSYC